MNAGLPSFQENERYGLEIDNGNTRSMSVGRLPVLIDNGIACCSTVERSASKKLECEMERARQPPLLRES